MSNPGEQQRRLFDTEPAPWEVDDRPLERVAAVLFVDGPPEPFDYLVPAELQAEVQPGRRVRAPLGRGNRLRTGYCVGVEERPAGDRKLKALEAVLDRRPLLSAAMLRLTRWIAEYYLCDWAAVLEAVVPMGVRQQAGTRPMLLYSIARPATGDPPPKLSAKQARILQLLAEAPAPLTGAQLARLAGTTEAPLQTLRKKGLIVARRARVAQAAAAVPAAVPRVENLALNPDQHAALEAINAAIDSGQHRTILVHGVTGSGKTEVYIQAIQRVVANRRQAIVLVPEISLTPQTLQRFRARFDYVAVLHSHLSDAERHSQWQDIAGGRVQVVVGARSAIFAPTPRLGLVVLDEEHESSFKQDSLPRYHARDVALRRSREEGVPLVLGSATPSLETWQRAQTGEYALVELPRRVLDRPLPDVGTIDLRSEEHGKFSAGAIARVLHLAMRRALDDGGQVILLLNRRGFATHIQCPACGFVLQCPECDISLTHHRTREVALCHYCDYEVAAPTECPQCQFGGIRYSGRGTQRLEAEVLARFPGVSCLRMDADAMQGRDAHEKALARFRDGEARILLGTQMIAKGLDFPNVTLVGVINADTALHLPDFRAAERTFHLVTQVAGRTGRGERGGRVLVQTFNPDHPAIRAAVRHDYAAFAAGELPVRQALAYPPFGSMVRLVVRGPLEDKTKEFARTLADGVRRAATAMGAEVRVLGPAPAPFARLRGNYRFQIQTQAPLDETLRQAVRDGSAGLQPPDDVQWIADVDPLDML